MESRDQMEDRRQFERWEVSIPCTVRWDDWVIEGQIANLSLGGAMITRVSAVPPKGALVVIAFQVRRQEVMLKGKLTSRVIHTILEVIEDLNIGSFGVVFQDPPEEVKSKLAPFFPAFISTELD